MAQKKIALFHPWIKSRGGAERVVLEILENTKHNIDVYTWAYDEQTTFPAFKKHRINVLFPRIGRTITKLHVLRGLFFPLSLLKKIPLEQYDTFLISTSGLAEFTVFRNRKKGNTTAYIHTPLREADEHIIKWNIQNRYKNKPIKKNLYLLATHIYRFLEKRAWKHIDTTIFNSPFTKKRAEKRKLLKKQKQYIIYPPIGIQKTKKTKKKTPRKKQFVYVSRFNKPKRQDVLINAWKQYNNKKEYKLLLIGTNDDKKYYRQLEELAKDDDTIQLLTNINDKQLKKIIEESTAGIFLGYQEDAGIIPLEILNLETPLLAVNEGGYIEHIKKHSQYHPIQEKHEPKQMEQEIQRALQTFEKTRKKKTTKKSDKNTIPTQNFVTEIDKILSL